MSKQLWNRVLKDYDFFEKAFGKKETPRESKLEKLSFPQWEFFSIYTRRKTTQLCIAWIVKSSNELEKDQCKIFLEFFWTKTCIRYLMTFHAEPWWKYAFKYTITEFFLINFFKISYCIHLRVKQWRAMERSRKFRIFIGLLNSIISWFMKIFLENYAWKTI